MEIALFAVPIESRDAFAALEETQELRLVEELRVLDLDCFLDIFSFYEFIYFNGL